MKNPNVKTRVVHSRTESAWNIVGQTLGGKHKAGNLQFTPQWIKVTDRLPEIGLIICYQNNEIYIAFYDGISGIPFTHWMPLPEPPEV